MATEVTTEDLKDVILELKKRLYTTTSENHLLKVKVRKLQSEVDKKDKQLESILDPRKSTCIRKIISERGATMIIHLKQRIEELEEKLKNKDNMIKKLQINLQTTKVYQSREPSLERKHVSLKNKPPSSSSTSNYKIRSRSLSITPDIPQQPKYIKSTSDIELGYVRLAQNLQKIKLANNALKQRPASHKIINNKTVENKLAQTSVSKDSVNGEKDNMEKYFERLFDEMKEIKATVSTLTTEQENTKKMLKDKNRNIEILSRKVKHLQKTSFKNTSPTKSQNKLKSTKDIDDKNSSFSYSQDSFEDDTPNNTPEKSSKNERTNSKESTILSNVESVSDDDDVETGESK